MIPGIDRVDAAPLPLPEAAWRITSDLQDKIREIVMSAGHSIEGDEFVDGDYRRWRLRMTDHIINVSVDSQRDPGRLWFSVQGDDRQHLRQLLSRYQRLPILKISRALNTQQLIGDFPKQQWIQKVSKEDKLMIAVRSHVTRAKYKILDERFDISLRTWAICLNTSQQLQIPSFGRRGGDLVMIEGFGTELVRLKRLMDLF